MTEFAVECLELCKSFGDTQAVQSLDLSVRKGEILAVVGPSGCGKTTLLRLIAGFETPDDGRVILGGKTIADRRFSIPPERRGVGMVFQDYALFPHMTVYENVGFGLDKLSRNQVTSRVSAMLKLVGLEDRADRHPHELSGGERQRVALARALTPHPVLVLLDEPFSNLDADRRTQMRAEVRAILKGIGATAIFVTHDQEEALFMGDRLAVLNQGRLEQVGDPEEVFHKPSTRFVAEFMGETDFLPGTVTPQGVLTEIGILPQQVDLPPGSEIEVAFRPDDVTFERHPQGQSMILSRNFKGALNIYRLRLPSGRLIHAMQPHIRILDPGTLVRARADAGHPLASFTDGVALAVTPLDIDEEPTPG